MELCSKKQCTGCFACMKICPKHAITNYEDNMGFLYPRINNNDCVNCGKCRSVCHVSSLLTDWSEPLNIYRYKGTDDVRMDSSSGGFFTLVSKYLLLKGFYIIGVIFDDDFLGAHFEITKSFDRVKQMRKSKYIEADLNNVYKDAESILKQGGNILFTGLPCQIAGFLKFINGKYKNQIITIDLFCFGNGSPVIYLNCLFDFLNVHFNTTEITKVDFRHKPFLENSHTVMDVQVGEKSVVIPARDFPYYLGYVNRLVFREACYNCRYHNIKRISDFTAGDVPGDRDPFGENIVLCNTIKAQELLREIEKETAGVKLIVADNLLIQEIKSNLNKERIIPRSYNKIKHCRDMNIIVSRYLKDKRYNNAREGITIKMVVKKFKKIMQIVPTHFR